MSFFKTASLRDGACYSTGEDDFDLVIRKVDSSWKIHACKSHDNITNQYDMRLVSVEQLVDYSVLNDGNRNVFRSQKGIDIKKLKKYVDDFLNKPTIDLNQDVG